MLTQIKARRAISNHTGSGFYGDSLALLPKGSLLGLGVRVAHPFFCLDVPGEAQISVLVDVSAEMPSGQELPLGMLRLLKAQVQRPASVGLGPEGPFIPLETILIRLLMGPKSAIF